MSENTISTIGPGSLVPEVLKIKHEGYRLIQICAVKVSSGYELTYSFGKEYDMLNLRMTINPGTEIISISNIYEPAFLYENEIHDLFDIQIKLMTLDYKGNLYRINQKAPFK